jgi:glycerol-3-phosphate acyltransferase PlsY
MIWAILAVLGAYLLGSVSFAYFAGKLKGIDLRQHGSGNLGATNAGRVMGMRWFVVVFTLDLLKGVAAVLIAKEAERRTGISWTPIAAAAAVVLGHSFTCFHGFKGGKAVATSLGVLAALVWQVALICLGVWIVAWLVGKLAFRAGSAGAVGPASVLAAIAVPFAVMATDPRWFELGHLPVTGFCFLLAVLVVARHRANILKLFKK